MPAEFLVHAKFAAGHAGHRLHAEAEREDCRSEDNAPQKPVPGLGKQRHAVTNDGGRVAFRGSVLLGV
ncbi:hypothetical protein GCM10027405_30180 [Arthrobacter alkaliphilus]